MNKAANQPMITSTSAAMVSAHTTMNCGMARIIRNATVSLACVAGPANATSTGASCSCSVATDGTSPGVA